MENSKRKEPLLKEPVVFRQQNDPDGGYDYFLAPIPMIRKGKGRALIVGLDSPVANKNDVRKVVEPTAVAKLSALWEAAEEAKAALRRAAEEVYEAAIGFTDEEIDKSNEMVNNVLKIAQKTRDFYKS